MKVTRILIAIVLKFTYVENRMLPWSYATMTPIFLNRGVPIHVNNDEKVENPHEKVIGLNNYCNNEKTEEENSDEYGFGMERRREHGRTKKPCAVVVLSNVQNPGMQSLLRKYRYDANGVLIPSSVQYFIKLPQGLRASPLLVPLNDKAFSPLGGFVRYYKEVPPIPQSWIR